MNSQRYSLYYIILGLWFLRFVMVLLLLFLITPAAFSLRVIALSQCLILFSMITQVLGGLNIFVTSGDVENLFKCMYVRRLLTKPPAVLTARDI